MIEAMGTRKAFAIFGCICIAYSVLHSIVHFVWLRHSPKPRRKTDTAVAGEELLVKENGGQYISHRQHNVLITAARHSVINLFSGEVHSDEKGDKDDTNVNYPDGTAVNPTSLIAPPTVALGSFMHIDAVGRRRGSNISDIRQDVDEALRRRPRRVSVDMAILRSFK